MQFGEKLCNSLHKELIESCSTERRRNLYQIRQKFGLNAFVKQNGAAPIF